MCQCPERGDPHFYCNLVFEKAVNEQCVNALKGATLISTRKSTIVKMEKLVVSMP